MAVTIVVDSTADLVPQVEACVKTVSLSIRFADEEYIPGVNMDTRRFYELLVEREELPTTSQASPFAFEEVFRQSVEAGNDVVCLTCSSKLSGTYQSAVIAAREFPGRVWVVDSGTIAIGLGILTEYALSLVDRGFSAEKITLQLLRRREDVRVLALVDTLEYLKKGGRISSAVAFAGGVLNIKPVITITGGEIRMLGKARGSRQANNLLVQEIEKAGGVDFAKPLLLGYTGLSDTLLRKYIADSSQLWEGCRKELPVCTVGSIVGTHVGPGAVAVAFFTAE